MSVINGTLKTRYRLRIKIFVKRYFWENDFADTVFGSNVLCKSVTRQRQITPLLYEFSCYSWCCFCKARRDPRFSKKDAAARCRYKVTGFVLSKSRGQLTKGVPTYRLLGGELTTP
jgi:hypothetical protein